jgi:hypothetical protein
MRPSIAPAAACVRGLGRTDPLPLAASPMVHSSSSDLIQCGKALMLLALAGLSTVAGAAESATLTLARKGHDDRQNGSRCQADANLNGHRQLHGRDNQVRTFPPTRSRFSHDASPEAYDASKRRGAHVLCGPVSSLRKADAEIGRLARHQESNAMQYPLLPSHYCPRRARAPDGH